MITSWGDYGLAGLVLSVVLYMQRSQIKYNQDLTDRVISSQIEFTKNLDRHYEEDLDKISASLIIIQEHSSEMLRLQKELASQIQVLASAQRATEEKSVK